jgi:hypothetical protein
MRKSLNTLIVTSIALGGVNTVLAADIVGGHRIGSFEPCVVHRDNTSNDWYDKCYFGLDGKNKSGFGLSDAGKECALESREVLNGWLSEKGSPVEKAFSILYKARGSKSIYTIITDHYNANYNPGEGHIWTWKQKKDENGSTIKGSGNFLKYNITIDTSGNCSIPSEDKIVDTVQSWLGLDQYRQLEEQLYPTPVEPAIEEEVLEESTEETAIEEQTGNLGDSNNDSGESLSDDETQADENIEIEEQTKNVKKSGKETVNHFIWTKASIKRHLEYLFFGHVIE